MNKPGHRGRPRKKRKPGPAFKKKAENKPRKPADPLAKLPTMPRGMSSRAQRAWRHLGAILVERGDLDSLELYTLETACRLYGQANGDADDPSEQRLASSAFLNFAKSLGLTPDTRRSGEVEDDTPKLAVFEGRA